jgi:hypothetical protein
MGASGKRHLSARDDTSKSAGSAAETLHSEVTVPLSVTSQFTYVPLDFFARFLRAISPSTSFHQEN